MIFRALFFISMMILVGCGGNKARYTMRDLLYQRSVEGVSKSIESFHTKEDARDTIPRKALLYKVCSMKVDGEDLWFPCDLDSTRLASLLENLNTRDSVKAMETRVVRISYATEVLKYKEIPVFSDIYVNDDGSNEALCASADGVTCDFLYAYVAISKKMPWDENWPSKKFYYPVGEKNDEENELSLMLDLIYADKLIMASYQSEPSLIPFEMCYKNGIAEPCDLDSVVVDSVQKIVEDRGDTLRAISYQAGSLAGKQFFIGAISNKHQCVSQDGEHCSELFALVRWNEKNWPIETYSMGTYRFDLNKMTFEINQILASDFFRYEGLLVLKKDGTFVSKVP